MPDPSEPEYAKSIAELRGLDEKTVFLLQYSVVRGGVRVEKGYYRDSLRRREADSRERTMEALTRKIVNLTWVILGLTCVSVVVVLVAELG